MAAQKSVVFHYLDIGRLGRGEVVNLFLKDAGIDYKEIRYPYDDTWAQKSKTLQDQGITRTGKLPAVEYQGLILTQHIPTLRYFARDLGSYDGETNQEKYVVDSVSDIYVDWRSQWVANLRTKTDKYKDEVVPEYHRLLDQYYSENSGPYLLGDKITYADFVVYQSIDNDERTGTLPSLRKLCEAIEKRPNISEYLRKNRPKKD
ncbi:glutathione S-transferase [Penicillium maclennaniae]|uniref:glutathione S-transferase n=1 Tax=Penicillium maclennaniae TaxID=1343394 RepID=UPI002540C6FA|nr:glutathione S-transferase [Penicillium maclennaniae]KAJ5666104.1 glutathione S-transferase [Penicillium maclennaniae]